MNRCTQCIDQIRIQLCSGVHGGNGGIGPVKAFVLFGRGTGNFGHDVSDAVNRVNDFLHGMAGFLGVLSACCHAMHGFINQLLDFFSRCRAFLRQAAHFACHNGESLAGCPCPGRLHCRVQCQNIGLESNAFDQCDNFADFARAFMNALHGRNHRIHDIPAFAGDSHAGIGELAGKACIFCILPYRVGQLFHAG